MLVVTARSSMRPDSGPRAGGDGVGDARLHGRQVEAWGSGSCCRATWLVLSPGGPGGGVAQAQSYWLLMAMEFEEVRRITGEPFQLRAALEERPRRRADVRCPALFIWNWPLRRTAHG